MADDSQLMRLPPELRDHIYHFVAVHDRLAVVANHCWSPPMLQTCKQLRNEYRDFFFADHLIGMTEYIVETGCWRVVSDKREKMDLFAHAHCADSMASANSLAVLQRMCQKGFGMAARVKCRRGIITLLVNGDPRYWMWWTRSPAEDRMEPKTARSIQEIAKLQRRDSHKDGM